MDPPRRSTSSFRAKLSRANAQGGRKRPATGSFPTAPQATSKSLPPELLRAIENDPLYMVVTMDGRQWLDPFTGQAIDIGDQGRAAMARLHLARSGSWRTATPFTLIQLTAERWRIDLTRIMPSEPRLRIFLKDNRGWLNPFSGALVNNIERPDGRITPRTIWQIAEHLAADPHAKAGLMLDMNELGARGRNLGAQQQAPTTARLEAPRMSDDLKQAQAVQQHMLADMPKPIGFEMAVHLSPLAGVAGDFYEATTLADGRILIALGDVSGHGMQAAIVVATALKTLRFVARSTTDLTELVCRFNDEIKPDLVPGQFITLFAAVLDPSSRSLYCVRAGHQPAILVNLARDDVMRRVGHSGMAIGLTSGATFRATLKPMSLQLASGDVLVQCSDGALEAPDGAGIEFGEARYLASVLRHYASPAQDLVDRIAADVSSHASGSVGDDLTVLALTVLPTTEEFAVPDAAS